MKSEPEEPECCKRCNKEIDPYENPAVRCDDQCQKLVHVACLRRGALPSNLLGDVFYDLYCIECSDSNEEVFIRQKLSWFLTIVLALYNLREKSYGYGRQGYFHWRSHICDFIHTKWDILFTQSVKPKKNWRGTISGTLSAFKDEFFKSGTEELGDQGWWKLIPMDIPEVIFNYFTECRKQGKKFDGSSSVLKSKEKSDSCFVNSNEIVKSEFEGKKCSTNPNYEQESTSGVPSSISSEDFRDMEVDVNNVNDDFAFDFIENTVEDGLPFLDVNELSEIYDSDCFQYIMGQQDENVDIFDEFLFETTENEKNLKMECDTEEFHESDRDNVESSKSNDFPEPRPSLFTQSKCKTSILNNLPVKINKECIKPLMTERQEEYLFQKLEEHKHLLNTAPVTVHRLYRKLKVRKEKRQLGLPVFDLDKFRKKEDNLKSKKITNILDKFMPEDFRVLFEQRLQGHCELTPIYIPAVDRKLDPLIWRYPSCPALWLKVMDELLAKVNHKKLGWKPQPMATVDFSYVRPQHIPAMNSLCSQFFWPGVDLTECLQHPHTTCVALYKKLVVGFAVMVPDVSFNEAYISFLLVRPEWQRAKIGTFMLYHLTQTVWNKDITLHVSVTNPAMTLYSKFGFQIESFLKNFYDKYIPPSSKESKNAFFLRLK
ncbi:cysteine-rich protein 2-binding protein [Copidosoma floridanum]|uniref:cysteine-rich protein 2-binding protein n=1 Tax=Copidosoma floridanum TaxID=29053 RepID=UPI0006C95FD2|nr:cysteine-rich protein 2-binding protein [Copidosoma floridanum]